MKIKVDNIPGFPGYYISKFGTLWSNNGGSWKKLKISLNQKTKRPQVHINGKIKAIHRLVAMAYIPNPDNKPCVCHKDNNPKNNYYKNLYWGTYKENTNQCITDGRFRPQGRKPNDINIINSIISDYFKGMTNTRIMRKYNIGNTSLHRYLVEAGIKPYKTGDTRKLNDDQVQKLIADFKSSNFTTYRELGKRYGLGYSGVRNYLRRSGLL